MGGPKMRSSHLGTQTLIFSMVALAVPSGASAYGSSERFAEGLTSGGGADHYFTGTPNDRYTCEVCHAGERVNALRVTGLPDEGYEPGETYDVHIEWPRAHSEEVATSLAIEWVNELGEQSGRSEPAPVEDWALMELCADSPAVATINITPPEDFDPTRQILIADDCLRTGVRLRWTADEDTTGVVSFHAVAVHANRDGAYSGDEVSVFRALFDRRGAPPPEASLLSASCNILAAQTPEREGWRSPWVVALAILAWRRR